MSQKEMVKGIDLSKVIKRKHLGNWVAISADYKNVIAFSKDVSALEKKVGSQDVVYMRAIDRAVDAGYCL